LESSRNSRPKNPISETGSLLTLPSSDESVPNFPFGTVLERRRDSSGPLDIAARSRLFGLLTQTASSGVATTLETQQDEPKVIR